MTDHDDGSLYERYAATAAGASDLAAARISRQVSTLISQALAASPRGQRDVASILGVSEARVSQVVNGDGNLRVGAIAKYMRALGYELRLIAVAVEEGLPDLPKAPTGRPRRRKPEASPPDGVGQFQYLYTFEAEPVEESDFKSVTRSFSASEQPKRIFFEAGSDA
ncbi:helix-turn-helix transcriptional regulator [Mycolicibacterium sp. D5.8-2]|uniref:helix-turn-helix domain-containing protein n=1 Tax=Mycolicibacterium sp. D5.8-2 TaxID=3085903 RepID=UPI00298C2EA0|nr:helix-turn-helix transcriptional regulator [Mycolicibacterium sp. D5.8-2]MDW5614606.1 helix-turn-helix transcriptional regulator [Mycolicibacterium sp. D5.8-2]